jgi:hypothetical protein
MRTQDAECCNWLASPGNKQVSYGFKTMSFWSYGAYWRDMRKLFAAELLGKRHVWAAR